MYKQVNTPKQIEVFRKGNFTTKVIASLEDEYGGEYHIINDDHCYLLCGKTKNIFQPTYYIFKEAFELLKTLPIPD